MKEPEKKRSKLRNLASSKPITIASTDTEVRTLVFLTTHQSHCNQYKTGLGRDRLVLTSTLLLDPYVDRSGLVDLDFS